MFAFRAMALMGLLLVATAVPAKLPLRNMTVELRLVAPTDADSSVVRTQPAQEHALEIQKVYVMNGERAQVKLNQSLPMQWTKSAVTQATSAPTAAGGASSTGGKGVENAITWMEAPAPRANWPPLPGWNSTEWTIIPTGIFSSGKRLPSFTSTLVLDDTISSPTLRPSGEMMYRFSPSL